MYTVTARDSFFDLKEGGAHPIRDRPYGVSLSPGNGPEIYRFACGIASERRFTGCHQERAVLKRLRFFGFTRMSMIHVGKPSRGKGFHDGLHLSLSERTSPPSTVPGRFSFVSGEPFRDEPVKSPNDVFSNGEGRSSGGGAPESRGPLRPKGAPRGRRMKGDAARGFFTKPSFHGTSWRV